MTHPGPDPYYADLVATRPLHRDEALGLWVAAGADAVASVLSSDLCRVRPPAEPVPRALLGSPAADIFRYLVRIDDGARPRPLKGPSANPDPERFDIFRKDRRLFTFGIGAHACPGEALATTIARAGVAELLTSGLALDRLAGTVTYRASANARIPLFDKA